MIETWKQTGLPLEAVLKGIDRTFEKWHSRKRKTQLVNSLAYCAQEVLTAARESSGEAPARPAAAPPFSSEELAAYLRGNAGRLREAALSAAPAQAALLRETADSLDRLAAAEHGDLEDLERRLTVMEERVTAAAIEGCSEQELLDHRRQLDSQLAPYRRKMTAEQLGLLEKQYLQRRVLESAALPRLSLFYL